MTGDAVGACLTLGKERLREGSLGVFFEGLFEDEDENEDE
jgi:hypothetical protein